MKPILTTTKSLSILPIEVTDFERDALVISTWREDIHESIGEYNLSVANDQMKQLENKR